MLQWELSTVLQSETRWRLKIRGTGIPHQRSKHWRNCVHPTVAVPCCLSAVHAVIAVASSIVTSKVVLVSTISAGVEVCTVIGSFVLGRGTVVTSLVLTSISLCCFRVFWGVRLKSLETAGEGSFGAGAFRSTGTDGGLDVCSACSR